jgi:hypothetical protein
LTDTNLPVAALRPIFAMGEVYATGRRTTESEIQDIPWVAPPAITPGRKA